MAVALTDLSNRADNQLPTSIRVASVLIVHGCPLFRAGLRSFLAQQGDCRLVGEVTHLDDVLALAGEAHPDIVLLDGGLTSTDPLDLMQQLRQVGVQGIMVFASPDGNEEMLFHFLKCGAMAYLDPFLTGEELLAKMHRVVQGEYLITDDVLVAQAARRECLARIRRDALRAARFADASLPSPQVGDCNLTEQERATLEQIARAGTNTQIAQALGISADGVKDRLYQIYRKLGVRNRTAAVVTALRQGWIAL